MNTISISFTIEELKELHDLLKASSRLSEILKIRKTTPFKTGFYEIPLITGPEKIIKTYEKEMLAYTE